MRRKLAPPRSCPKLMLASNPVCCPQDNVLFCTCGIYMKWLLDKYYHLLNVLIGLLLGLMLVPVVLQVSSRFTDAIPRFIWTEEVARFCFVWIVMIGSAIAVRDESHFDVALFADSQTHRQRGLSKLLVHSAMAALAMVFAWYGLIFAKFGYIQSSEMWGINMLSIYISFPIAGISWLIFLLEKIFADIDLIRHPSDTAVAQDEMGSDGNPPEEAMPGAGD